MTTKKSPKAQPKRAAADVVARDVVNAYFNPGVTIHDIVEHDAAGFQRLIAAINGTPSYDAYLRKLRALGADDERGREMCSYLEAGYLIGLAMGRREGGAR